MRIKVLSFAASFFLITNYSAGMPQSQATVTSSPQAVTLLGQSLKAMTGSTNVADVTLTGTVEWIAGSDDETGTATYRALGNMSRLDLSLSGGTRSEILNCGATPPTGSWIGPDGVSHSMAYHNLLTAPGWFPPFAFANIYSSTTSLVTYVGPETHNGLAVIHLSYARQIQSSTGSMPNLLQHLSQVDVYIDSNTFLPLSFVFNMHPDVDAATDIPTEIRYANFQNVGGVQIPFHVQKYVNNSLVLDLQFQNVSLNTGVTAAQIAGQ